jgi:hypothetical protein
LLDDAERLRVLKNIGNHLGTGGTFVFDASIVSLENNPLRQAGTFRTGSREYRRFLSSKMLTKSTKQITLVFEIYDSGNLIECIEERGVVGVVAREKILDLLNRCDFTALNEYGDYDFTRYKEGSELLIIEAMKKTS